MSNILVYLGMFLSCSVLIAGEAMAETASERIINGTRITTKNSPIVQVRQTKNGKDISLCSGSVISADTILTAWHCVTRSTANNYVIIGGSKFAVKRVVTHPDVREDRTTGLVNNDVAVLTLSRKTRVSPLIVGSKTAPVTGDALEIMGYGYDQYGTIGVLQYGITSISAVTSSHIESYFEWASNKSNTCSGDSGGPAIETRTIGGKSVRAIVGIVSTGTNESCTYGDTTDYVRLSSSKVRTFLKRYAPSAKFV